MELDVAVRFKTESAPTMAIQTHDIGDFFQMIHDAVQATFEIRIHRIDADFGIALEFAVLEFLASGLRVFAQDIAKNACRNIAHQMLAIYRNGIIRFVIDDFGDMVDLVKKLVVRLLNRRPHAVFFLDKRRDETGKRILRLHVLRIDEFRDGHRRSIVAILVKKTRSRKRIDHIRIGANAQLVRKLGKSQIDRKLLEAFAELDDLADGDSAHVEGIAFLVADKTSDQGLFGGILAGIDLDIFKRRQVQEARALLEGAKKPGRVHRRRMVGTVRAIDQEVVALVSFNRTFHKVEILVEQIALFDKAQDSKTLVLHIVEVADIGKIGTHQRAFRNRRQMLQLVKHPIAKGIQILALRKKPVREAFDHQRVIFHADHFVFLPRLFYQLAASDTCVLDQRNQIFCPKGKKKFAIGQLQKNIRYFIFIILHGYNLFFYGRFAHPLFELKAFLMVFLRLFYIFGMKSPRIHALSEDVINKIAAGEVVERPASVVKELVENSLDAGATRIEIQIANGGKSSILIRDNGCGMPESDLDICYKPHTTSKLTSAEDLFHLATNGFRGEAVASIAAISKLSITSREADSPEAHTLRLVGGHLESKSSDASPRGTTFLIEDLFFNAPVRKTFLGSDTVEASRVLDTVTRISMAHPEVRFDYRVNGHDVFTGVESDDPKSRIAEALGTGIAKSMLPVDYEEAGIRVSGFAVPPDKLQYKRNKLYFYVQKRPIWNPIMAKAIARAYEPYGNSNAPIAVLFLEMPDTSVDVNVHPTKREVRFANENDVFMAVNHAVRDAFQRVEEENHPTIRISDFSPKAVAQTEEPPSMPEPSFAKPQPVQGLFETDFSKNVRTTPAGPSLNTTKNVKTSRSGYSSEDPGDIIQDLFSLPENGNIIPLTPQNLRPPTRMDKATPPQFFQLANTYLVCEDSEGILLIDQNAAHQRILYERALASLDAETALESQELLFPEIIELAPTEASVLPELVPTLEKLGFHLELFGKNTYQLRGTPRDLPFSRSVEAVKTLVADVLCGDNPGNPSHEILAKAWAKSNAIQAGDKLNSEEMTHLMSGLLSTQDPMSSPSGRPTLMRLPVSEINKRFKR